MRPKQVLLLKVEVDLGVMAMKKYPLPPRYLKLKPHPQVPFLWGYHSVEDKVDVF